MADDKYIVTKADGTPVDDAVVIRLKDPFAATALYTYSNTILGFLEMMQTYKFLERHEEERLMGIVDYFHAQANRSISMADKRLPD